MHALARDALRRPLRRAAADEQAELARARRGVARRRTGCSVPPRGTRSPRAARQGLRARRAQPLRLADDRAAAAGAVLDWLAQLPADELDRRPRLLLAAAWSLALSERHEEASRLVERILARRDVDDALRCECALILSGAAVFADDPDRFAELHDPWAEAPPLRDPLLLQVHANRSAFRTLLDGEPALARLRQQQAPRGDAGRLAGLPRPAGATSSSA